ncbi:PLP-dependent aminotransferase family protein [Acidobacteria bacterium AB60]|nr:PLP-dependent aminotransferase family protein [Acidobacteria bacterium AB60]
MTRVGASVSPVIAIDRDEAKPLHKQVYDGYRDAILRGDLVPGQKVPSSRELALDIRVSRFPVLHAYAQLTAEGYFESQTGSGTFISSTLPEATLPSDDAPDEPSQGPSGNRPVSKRAHLYPKYPRDVAISGLGAFCLHHAELDRFPFHVWSALLARHSRNPSSASLRRIDPMGSPRFRKEICHYLRTARSVKCEPEQVMIVSGSQQALDITSRALLDPGDTVALEEPGYSLQRKLLAASGCRLKLIPVDEQGMDVTRLARCRAVKAAFVTPSHQFPMGSTMSATRRLHLLNWAQNTGSWVVEDDYDSEYRYDAQPIASLQGLDANARVIYIGTFSKILFPSLRVGYIVIPRDLVPTFESVRFALDIFPPYLYQEALADFLALGHLGRYIRKMRQIYSERRTVLMESLQSEFGDFLEKHGSPAGMHVSVTLPDGFDDVEIAARAALHRLLLWPLSRYYAGEKPRHGFVLGYGSAPAEHIPAAVKQLRALLID